METFQLAQISDLHVAVQPYNVSLPDGWGRTFGPQAHYDIFHASSHDPDLLEGAIRALNNRRDQLDAVIISGDLATTGLPDDLALVAAYVESPVTTDIYNVRGQPTLQSLQRQLILFPGNHDRYANRFFWPGGKEFDRVFSGQWSPKRDIQTTQLRLNAQTLAIVCADFCLREASDSTSPLGILGQGKAYDDILEALRKETAAQKKSGAAVLWAVHFPPEFPGISNTLQLINDSQLLQKASDEGVQYIMAGHTHQPLPYSAPSFPDIEVHCAGTTCQYVAPYGNFIHLYDLQVDGTDVRSVMRTDLKWVQSRGAFV